jgi:hypothetical protein
MYDQKKMRNIKLVITACEAGLQTAPIRFITNKEGSRQSGRAYALTCGGRHQSSSAMFSSWEMNACTRCGPDYGPMWWEKLMSVL